MLIIFNAVDEFMAIISLRKENRKAIKRKFSSCIKIPKFIKIERDH